MNDLKKEFFFLIDFFLPEQGDFSQKQVRLVRKGSVRILDHIVYPVEYSGFFQSRFYLLLGREIFLFDNKEEICRLIRERLNAGLDRLFRMNYRELALEIGSALDEFEEPSESLFWEYMLDGRSVFFLMPAEFLRDFVHAFFRLREIKKFSRITELLAYMRARLYQDSLSSFWDMKNFFGALPDREIQGIFHMLLKGNKIEETMLAGFIAFFQGTSVMDRLMRNISKNLQEDVIKNSSGLMRDRRWIEECVYLVRLALEELIFTGQISLAHLDFWRELRSRIREERFGRILREKCFEQWLMEGKRKGVLDRLRIMTDMKTILVSLKGMDEKYLSLFLHNVGSQALEGIREDYRYHQKTSSEQDAENARIRIVEILKGIYYEEKAQDILLFQDMLSGLDPSRLNQLLELTGIIRFSQALLGSGKEFRQSILASLSGVAKNILADIASGKVRFKQSFGEQTVKLARRDVLRTCYFLRDEAFLKE